MSIKRLYVFVNRHFLRRSLPHGVINWRYLLPDPPPHVRIHRQLWLSGRPSRLPVFLFFFGEIILWLRWVTFAGWLRSWRTVRRLGTPICERDGIGKAVQFKRVLCLSLGYCVTPTEIYAFGFYRRNYVELWDYIFAQEVHAFHRRRSAELGASRESLALLQDKFCLTNLLKAQGVPMAPILELVSRNTPFDPEACLQKCPRLFCKPRHGSASRDTFVIDGDIADRFHVIAVKNGMMTRPSTMAQLRKAMSTDDFLIQPFMDNHPVLAALCPTKDAVTLRLITENHALHGLRCYSATLEMPGVSDENKHYFIILPIDPPSGRVMRFPDRRLLPQAQSRHDAFYARLGDCTIPFWDTIMKSAINAHRNFPDVYAIAWDFVVTPTGPYMLEGNTGWGVATSQIIHGGLLADYDSEE